ncbi:PRKR-interacting protein 1 [Sciurus carolinensis]|uniref:PRKR-interacting protein 1 n=1 Tax=Sciurus carolinensis TaxID=30640 RepID=A0AA41N6G0_SCICA|nr:PRKR-interacting protein 1 [Sciurus carolinensis]
MASLAAWSVRPPGPKKEPQALVVPKNAAEEQKLKLERLMKNPPEDLGTLTREQSWGSVAARK